MDGLTEGRIVHYVLGDGSHRPAILVRVWEQGNGCSNLQVFVDGTNDLESTVYPHPFPHEAKAGLMWRTSVCFSESPVPNTWHWIEKTPASENVAESAERKAS